MRPTFARTLVELAERDDRVFLVVGDVGFGVLETFAQRFPDRYLNVGVAEANLAGVSAGLALAGSRPFMYSIGNFPTLRCLEQVRNDICYNRAPVVVVCVGGGLAYGSLGATHHATEDLAIMRALPGMTVVAPADPVETELATRAALAHEAPMYL
ncbi:MAG: transketolase family protein, partial [Candidatus Limnocylindria bacterium]